jgi:hypothetical protein
MIILICCLMSISVFGVVKTTVAHVTRTLVNITTFWRTWTIVSSFMCYYYDGINNC